ncbi:MAG: type II secretion system protein [Proteobacteria bacterium]|nr:type II secretion system protein [Pseudomonadota bacterium]
MNLPKHIKAFSLLEIGLCLFIIGIVGTFILPLLTTTSKTINRADILEKQKKITQSLASYTMRNHRLPSASLPSQRGKEISSQFIGIVPYQTLGLDENLVKDKQGHWFTYAVTSSLTQTKNTNESDSLLGDSNFCTSKPAENDLKIQNNPMPKDDFVAFVIVAHNCGNGSYLNDGTTHFNLKDTSQKSVCEQQNASKSGVFCIDSSDDIVFWASRNNFTAHYMENVCLKQQNNKPESFITPLNTENTDYNPFLEQE